MSIEHGTAPRVNKATFPSYIGRTVTLVGAVESHSPTSVVLRTSDNGIIHVQPGPGSDYTSKVVEVIGRVADFQTMQEFRVTSFGEHFDLETYDKLVILASSAKYRSLFD